MITKRHLSRRAVLKGMGVTVALPFLEAMAPAATPLAQTAAKGKLRFVAVEMVHGAAGSSNYGLQHNLWSPAAVGRSFDLSPTALAHGSFTIGDQNATIGSTATFSEVEWWGSNWWKENQLSGGPAPAAFKGFAESSPSPPTCSTRTRPGPSRGAAAAAS